MTDQKYGTGTYPRHFPKDLTFAGSVPYPYLRAMPYDAKTRDRVEAWPKKGTRAKLQAKAREKGKTLGAYLNDILERNARGKRANPEEGD